jgi:hypothetical protein
MTQIDGLDIDFLHVRSQPNLIYFNEVDRGGHFAVWEHPQLFSDAVRATFSSLR